jgi:hypothetical protein
LPLAEKARIEVYLPDLPKPTYQNLLEAFEREFTYTFGGCTIARGLNGSYLSRLGQRVQDRVNLIFTDAPFAFEECFESISRYASELQRASFAALEEEAVLVVALKVYHVVPLKVYHAE